MADTAEQIKALTEAINGLLQLQLRQKQTESVSTPHGTQHMSKSDLYNELSARVEKYAYGSGDETKPFKKWLLRHEYTVVTEAASLPPEMQTRLVLDKLGQTEFDRLVDHVAPTDPTKLPQVQLIETLKELFRDKVPITRRRIEILNYRYDKATPISEHIDRINRHAAEFDRANSTDDGLRIVLLLQSFCFAKDAEDLKRLALRVVEKNRSASLKDVAAELEAHLNVSSSMKTLENPAKVSSTCSALVSKSKPKQQVPRYSVQNDQVRSKLDSKCFSCGGGHVRASCKFREAVCHKCAKKGHIASVCRSGPKDPKNVDKKASIVTQAISAVGKRRRRYITISIDKTNIRLQYDTGSDITVIGRDEWVRLGSPRLVEGEIVEHAGGSNLELIGKFRASVRAVDRDGVIDICVAGRNGLNLIGLDAIDSLRLWPALLNDAGEVKCVLSLQQQKAFKFQCSVYGSSRVAWTFVCLRSIARLRGQL